MSEYRVLGERESPSLAFRNAHILKAMESDVEYLLEIETFTPANSADQLDWLPEACPKCGTMYDYKGIGRIEQQVKDTPAHGKRVRLLFKRRRYQCRSCKATFMEAPDWLHPDRHSTRRLIAGVQQDALIMPNSHVAHKYGVDDKTVKNVLDTFITQKASDYHIATPRVLGIDELYIMKRPRGVFTNIEQRTIIEMKPDRNIATVKAFIETLDRPTIEVVTIDMWNGYRSALRTVLPDAQIVVDKFHFQRQANYALEKIRKDFKGGLDAKGRRKLRQDRFTLLRRKRDLDVFQLGKVDGWRKEYPGLIEAYELKEQLYDIYDKSKTEQEARERWKAWLSACPEPLRAKGGPWFEMVQAMNNWENEVFAYFKYEEKFTNAYTESMNRIIRDLDRSGRGYSFEALRAKVLYGQEFKRKPVKHKLKAEIQELLDRGVNLERAEFRSDVPGFYEELQDALYNTYGTDMESVAAWLKTHLPEKVGDIP